MHLGQFLINTDEKKIGFKELRVNRFAIWCWKRPICCSRTSSARVMFKSRSGEWKEKKSAYFMLFYIYVYCHVELRIANSFTQIWWWRWWCHRSTIFSFHDSANQRSLLSLIAENFTRLSVFRGLLYTRNSMPVNSKLYSTQNYLNASKHEDKRGRSCCPWFRFLDSVFSIVDKMMMMMMMMMTRWHYIVVFSVTYWQPIFKTDLWNLAIARLPSTLIHTQIS